MLTATPRGLDVTATPLMTSPGFEPGTQPHLDAAFSIGSRNVTDTALHLLIYLNIEIYLNFNIIKLIYYNKIIIFVFGKEEELRKV